jgi:hypothetical protein
MNWAIVKELIRIKNSKPFFVIRELIMGGTNKLKNNSIKG